MGSTYGEFCGLARALDLIGGRWSLLIVRELSVRPARYNELRGGLPGIATNLLADRLRELETGGVVQRSLDPVSNSVVYSLTPWGKELREVIGALVRWSTPLMVSGPRADDSFRPHWLVVALSSLLEKRRSSKRVRVGLEVEGTLLVVTIERSGTHVADNDQLRPATVLRAEPAVALGLASGMLPAEHAVAAGELDGDLSTLEEAFPVREVGVDDISDAHSSLA